MSIKQISVFLENRPGKLKEMTAVLAAHGIDMRALSLAETKDCGIVRIIVDDAYDAANVLKENGFVASLTKVLAVEVEDIPGGLDKVLSYFANAQVNIEYMYAFTGIKNPGHAFMVFRVADTKAAEVKLAGMGLKIISQDDLASI